MRAATEDRSASAVIRDFAMVLFAQRGAADVTIREVAAAAGVSPGLVIHHYGSKQGLQDAVERRVVTFVHDVLTEATGAGDDASAALSTLFTEAFEREPAVVAYIGRLLGDGGPAADELFASLFEATVAGMDALVAAGVARPARDERVRAALLLVNDLALLVFRERIAAVLGIDPLTRPGLAAWADEVAEVYSSGMFAVPAPCSTAAPEVST